MAINVTCKCGQQFAAADNLAGQRVKCAKCGATLQIPPAAPAMPADMLEDLANDDVLNQHVAGPAPGGPKFKPKKKYNSSVGIHWPKLLTAIAVGVVVIIVLVVVGTFAIKGAGMLLAWINQPREVEPQEPETPDVEQPISPFVRPQPVAITPVPKEEPDPKPVEKQGSRPALAEHLGTLRLTFSPDGKTLATADDDGVLRLWDVEAGEVQRIVAAPKKPTELPALKTGQEPPRRVDDSRAQDRPAKQAAPIAPEPIDNYLAIAFSASGRYLAAKLENSLMVWKLGEQAPPQKYNHETASFTTEYVAFNYGDDSVVTAFDTVVVVMNVESGAVKVHPYGHFVLFMAASPLENKVALTKKLTRLEQQSGKSSDADLGLDVMNLDTGETEQAVFQATKELPASPTSIAFTPNGEQLAVATYAGPLVMLNSSNWQPRTVYPRASSDGFFTYAKLAVSPQGQAVVGLPVYSSAAVSGDGRYPPELWHAGESELRWVGDAGATDVAFSPDGLIAVAQSGGTIRFFDPETGEERFLWD